MTDFIPDERQSMRNPRPRIRYGERASSIVEAMLCMLLLLLLTFGLLQFFYYAVAQMVTDYAAFRAARSATVGFREDDYQREARLKVIPAAGQMRSPVDLVNGDASSLPFKTAIEQFYYERLLILDYMRGHQGGLRYQYWWSTDASDELSTRYKTSFSTELSNQGDSFTAHSTFTDYPWIMPFRGAFQPETKGRLDITGEAKMSRQSAAYLE